MTSYPVLFCWALVLESSLRIVRNVEWMVCGRLCWVQASLDDESVGFAPDNVDLGDQEAVNVPRNSPPNSALNTK